MPTSTTRAITRRIYALPEERRRRLRDGVAILLARLRPEDAVARVGECLDTACGVMIPCQERPRLCVGNLRIRVAKDASSFGELAQIHELLGHLADAERYYLEGLKVQREVGNRSGEATALINLSGFYLDGGDPRKSLCMVNDAFSWLDHSSDRLPAITFARALRPCPGEATHHRCVDVNRADGVDADVLRSVVEGR